MAYLKKTALAYILQYRYRAALNIQSGGAIIRKRVLVLAVAVVITLFSLCLHAEAQITARAYLLVEKETMAVLAGKNYHEELPPASTTKVMTTILALEKLDGSSPITATASVRTIPPSKLNLAPGKSYRAADLIRGTMVESANDAAYTLGLAIAGSEEDFAAMMNEKAREIGAINTHFRNASGLYVPGHYSTCWDLALMFRYALSNDQFREIVSQRYFLFKGGRQDVTQTTTDSCSASSLPSAVKPVLLECPNTVTWGPSKRMATSISLRSSEAETSGAMPLISSASFTSDSRQRRN